MKKISLLQMQAGTKGKIVEISGGEALQHRLMTMGIHAGRAVVKLSHVALRGPVTIRIAHSTVAIGHGMAGKIFIEL